MTKVLLATEKPFAPAAVADIKKVVIEAGFDLVLLEKYKDQSDLVKAVADVEAIIIRSDLVTREVIEAAKKLKIVVRAGAGYDNIDLPAATEHGVVAMNTPGQNSNAVAELAFGMMIYHARKFFSGASGTELKDKSIGIHAYGNVGKCVARIAKGFSMKVYAFDPFVKKEEIVADGVFFTNSAAELYSKCQYVSLHIPANASTKKSINYDLLSTMPNGAVLVNTARKEVIDEDGLLKIFASRKDFSYLSDIEPDCLAALEAEYKGRFYCTPKKAGAQTEEANVNAGIAAARQIVGFILRGDATYKVN